MLQIRKVLLIVAVIGLAHQSRAADSPEPATQIRVRILHSKTHRPMKGRRVEVQFSGMDGQWYSNAPHLIARTGSDGVVTFEVKQPLPRTIDIVDLTGYPCSFPEEFPTLEVLAHGVVGKWTLTGVPKADEWCTADTNARQPQQRPGEVVFFVHPLNLWQRIRYSMER